jgi:hypothetical protein
MCNALASFQAMTNLIFRDFIDQGWLTVYMDDILIHTSGSIEEHREKVKKVLQCLEDNDLYLKPSKCAFKCKETDYLGIIISNDRIQMDPKKLASVKDWQSPKDVSEIQ